MQHLSTFASEGAVDAEYGPAALVGVNANLVSNGPSRLRLDSVS
jgi:hypothetical protein